MSHVIYLKVARVGTLNSDMTTSIERNTITLESGKNFNNFVGKLHVQNYLNSEPPTVEKVVEVKHGKVLGEVDKKPYQLQVQEALDKAKNPNQAVDYKALSEKQSNSLADMEKRLAMFEERLKVSESGGASSERQILEAKAKDLEIQYRNNIGDDKLLSKIQELDPEFKV